MVTSSSTFMLCRIVAFTVGAERAVKPQVEPGLSPFKRGTSYGSHGSSEAEILNLLLDPTIHPLIVSTTVGASCKAKRGDDVSILLCETSAVRRRVKVRTRNHLEDATTALAAAARAYRPTAWVENHSRGLITQCPGELVVARRTPNVLLPPRPEGSQAGVGCRCLLLLLDERHNLGRLHSGTRTQCPPERGRATELAQLKTARRCRRHRPPRAQAKHVQQHVRWERSEQLRWCRPIHGWLMRHKLMRIHSRHPGAAAGVQSTVYNVIARAFRRSY